MKNVIVVIAQELSCGVLLLCSSSWRRDLFAGAVTRSQVCHSIQLAGAGRREHSLHSLSESPAQMFQDVQVEEFSPCVLPCLYLCRKHSCFTVCTEQEVAESRSVIPVMVTLIACLGSKRLTFQGSWEGSRSQSPDFLATWLLRLDCLADLSQR